jgi:hypothetical protein
MAKIEINNFEDATREAQAFLANGDIGNSSAASATAANACAILALAFAIRGTQEEKK